MVLQNFWIIQRFVNTYSTSTLYNPTGMLTTNGDTIAAIQSGNTTQAMNNYGVGMLTSLLFGTGTTDVSVLDYSLDTDITDSLSVSTTAIVGNDSSSSTIQYQASIINNSGDDITITEIGIKKILRASLSTATTTYVNRDILVAREVLDTPITIAAGETKTINYVWTMQ